MLEPSQFIKRDEELSLSGPAFTQLVQATLRGGTAIKFPARGFSMSPFIRNGDIITISPLTNKSITRGDIVAFVCPITDKFVVHRVVERNGRGEVCIAGDNLPKLDTTISEKRILGRVTNVERKGKKIILGLGLERSLIATLTRHGLIYSFFLPIMRCLRSFFKRNPNG